MKQSAVEFIKQEFGKKITDVNYEKSFDEIIEQAKEIEEKQRGYSDGDVENILIEYVKTNPSKPYRVLSWFGQFKKIRL